MDCFPDPTLLVIDAILFGVSCYSYISSRTALKWAENIQVVENASTLVHLASQPKKLDCIAVCGTVKALSDPLHSISSPGSSGVVRKLTTTEYYVMSDKSVVQTRQIDKSVRAVPFALECGNIAVEVIDPLSATSIDLQTISSVFKPFKFYPRGLKDGRLKDVTRLGLLKTEQMLQEGDLLTGIGELSLSADSGGFQLRAPSDGSPFLLTSLTMGALRKKLEGEKQEYRNMSIALGLLGLVILGFMARQWWQNRSKKKNRLEERKLRLEMIGKERGACAVASNEEFSETQACVVCRDNPKEFVLIPCGHVCICADCSLNILDLCPICRAEIESCNRVFIS